jgi:hypothetical protein
MASVVFTPPVCVASRYCTINPRSLRRRIHTHVQYRGRRIHTHVQYREATQTAPQTHGLSVVPRSLGRTTNGRSKTHGLSVIAHIHTCMDVASAVVYRHMHIYL